MHHLLFFSPASTSESDDLFRFWRGLLVFWSNVLTSGWYFFVSSQSLWASLVLLMFLYLLNTWWIYYMIPHTWPNISMSNFFSILCYHQYIRGIVQDPSCSNMVSNSSLILWALFFFLSRSIFLYPCLVSLLYKWVLTLIHKTLLSIYIYLF